MTMDDISKGDLGSQGQGVGWSLTYRRTAGQSTVHKTA